MIYLLLDLPNDVLAFVLFPFFSTIELCTFDVAVSNHRLRPLLFEIYPSLNLEFAKGSINRLKILWFCKRSVHLRRLVFENHLLSHELTQIFDTIEHYPKAAAVITYIDLSLCIRSVYLSHLTQIFSSCKFLSEIILSGYKRNEIFCRSLQMLPELTSIDLSKCQMPDALSESISNHCSALTTLKLQGCSALTCRAVISLSHGCHSLTSLNLSRCEKVTDAALMALSQGCSSLTVLDLKRDHKVTDKGIKALSDGCPSLSTLHLEKCKKITPNGFRELSIKLPHCRTYIGN